MKQSSKGARFGLKRRQVLLGLAATTLAACSGAGEPGYATRQITEADPLARFRVHADAGESDWLAHLHAPHSANGPQVLALSGGGEDGAFGAGALVGWSATGRRPRFDIVTGVSTGALIAPFAFLGQSQDAVLHRIFTAHDAGDIMRLRPFQAVYSESIYDTEPLADLIETYTPPELLDDIAARHGAGGRLFIVTSDLDSARASVWDMGAIAQAGQYDLFRGIMRASAALPGLFSPVELRYVADNTTYRETHIDGGVHMQFLAIPNYAFATDRNLAGGHVFLLINNTLNPDPVEVSRTALGISQQALTTMSRANAQFAVNATRHFARANGMRLSVTSIDPNSGIVYDPSHRFSSVYMTALFQHGYLRAVDDTLWTVVQ
ncbi:MAG: patatin-like phospholipase family protein [Rhodobacteraceae bacterium]|jgi:predicted acylesterase/phospholipase RssA|nr:patatin-like phospholipase family protein [Paracoccaceae bacterium]